MSRKDFGCTRDHESYEDQMASSMMPAITKFSTLPRRVFLIHHRYTTDCSADVLFDDEEVIYDNGFRVAFVVQVIARALNTFADTNIGIVRED